MKVKCIHMQARPHSIKSHYTRAHYLLQHLTRVVWSRGSCDIFLLEGQHLH